MIALNLAQSVRSGHLFDLRLAIDKDLDESAPVFRSMRLSSNTFSIQFSTSTTFTSEHFWNPPDDDIRLSIQYASDNENLDILFVFDMCNMSPRCKIQSLFISFPCDPQRILWRAWSGDLPEIESIHLSKTPIKGLIAALKTRDTQGLTIAFPSLRALELEDIDFKCDEPEYLQSILMKRAKRDVGLHTPTSEVQEFVIR